MNLVLRKLSMLKHSIEIQEENAKISGYTVCSNDIELKNNINDILNKLSVN